MGSKAVLAALGVTALIGSAGAGAFLASRLSEGAPAPVPTVTANAPASEGVEATEAVVDDKPAALAPAEPAPAAAAAPVSQPQAAPPVAKPARRAPAARVTPSAPARTIERPSAPAPARRPESDRVASQPANLPEPATELPKASEAAPNEEARPAEPVAPLPRFEEVTVPADAVIGLQMETTLSSDTARVEDRVSARVARDVRANGRVAIPAGSRVLGSVSEVERGGKMRERARLGVRFHTVILGDGTELPLQTETVVREGESPGNASAAKVGGGAIGGAILGAILGGGKGAAIGAGVGAGAGTAAVMAGGRRAAQIQSGSPMTVKVLSPVNVTVER